MQNKAKKILSTLLALTLALGLFAAMPLAASAAGVTRTPADWEDVQRTVNEMEDGDILDLSALPINHGGTPGDPLLVNKTITISKSITVTSNQDPLGLAPGSAINPIFNLYFKLKDDPTVTFTNLMISSRDVTQSIVSGTGSVVVETAWFYSSFNDDTGSPPAQIEVDGDVLVKGTVAKNADGAASPTTAIGGIATTAAGGVPGAAIKANNVTVEGGAINGAPAINLGAASETSGNGIEASGNVTVNGSLVLLDGGYYNTATIDGGIGMKGVVGAGDSNGGNAIVAGGSVTVNSGGIAGGTGVGEGSVGGIAIIAGGNISLKGERIEDEPIYYSCWVRGGAGAAESGISIQFSGNASSPTRYLTAETALICRIGGGAPADYTIYMQNNDVAILEDSRVGFSADDTLPLFNGGSYQFIAPERTVGTNGGARPYAPAGGSDNDNIDIAELTGDIAAGTYTKWSYEHSSRTITVTDNVNIIGTVTGATDKLKIKIPDTKTVTWKANYSSAAEFTPLSLIEIDGKGTFDVADGIISSNKEAVRDVFTLPGNEATIKVSGGTVSTTGSDTSAIVGGIVEMSGGTVSATGANGIAVKANTVTVSGASTVVKATGADGIAIDAGSNTVTVSGGTVEATGSNGIAIKANGASTTITVDGGTVSATTGTGINATGNIKVGGASQSSIVEATGTGGTAIKSTGIVTFAAGTSTVSAASGTPIEAEAVAVHGSAVAAVNSGGAGYAIKAAKSTGVVNGGKLTITGDVCIEDDGGYLLTDNFSSLSELKVNGNVRFEGQNSYIHSKRGPLTITGNVTFAAVNSYIKADNESRPTNGGTVDIGGSVTFAGAGAKIEASDSGKIYIAGTLSGNPAITVDSVSKTAPTNTGITLPAPHDGGTWDDYSDAASHVYVKVPPPPPPGSGSTATNASITPAKADFDKNGGEDIDVTLNKGSYMLQGLKNGSYTLKSGTDYTVSGNTVVIKVAYLNTLDVGEQTITFDMSGGTDPKLTITVKDTTPSKYVNPFTDVIEGAWYYDDVRYVYENGLMTGTSADKFSPESALTRGMIVTILYRHAGEPDVSGLTNPFGDVAEGQWYTNAVKWAADNGIVDGYGNGRFGPDDNITRQDLAVILVRCADFAGIGLSVARAYPGFSDDADMAGYAKGAVERLFKAGVINGKTGNLFDPQGQAARAETAAMLHRMLAATEG